MYKTLIVFTFTLCLMLVGSVQVAAEDQSREPEAGLLAVSSGLPYGSAGVSDIPWAGTNLDGDAEQQAPLSGSVSKLSDKFYEYRVINSSEDQYTARISVIQIDKNGKLLQKNNRSLRISAGDAGSGKIRANPAASNVSLKLEDWRRKEKERSDSEIIAMIDSRKAEIVKLESQLSFPPKSREESAESEPVKLDISQKAQPKKFNAFGVTQKPITE